MNKENLQPQPNQGDGILHALQSIASGIVPAKRLVQMVYSNYQGVASGATTMPQDDTIPQITEGNEFMTLAITPSAATNILVIQIDAMLANSAASTISGALFQDSTANALAAHAQSPNLADRTILFPLIHIMAAGTTSSTTFRFRAGSNAAGTITFNGLSAARLYGAIDKSRIMIWEYAP